MKSCFSAGDRAVVWTSDLAGESLLCEKHYQFYRRKFPHLIARHKTAVKPSKRFSEEGEKPVAPPPVNEQLSL